MLYVGRYDGGKGREKEQEGSIRWNQDAEARARQRHSLHRLGLRTKRLDCVPNSAMDFGTDTVRSGNVTRARPRRGRLMDGGW
jgi:hypothetical protein